MPIFDQAHPKTIEITFSFFEFAPVCQKQSIPSIHSWDTANFRVPWPDCPFLTIPTQKPFDQLLIYVNLYQHAKNQAISLSCSGDMFDWKILQFDWLKTFWPISHELKFSQIWNLCRNTENNINFHCGTKSVKINDNNFQKFKKPCFWPIFGPFSQFWEQNFFSGKSSCYAQLHMDL